MRRLALAALLSCTAAGAGAQASADSAFAAGMRAFWANELAAALPLLRESAAGKNPKLDHVLFYAETARRQGQFGAADSAARAALARSPCSSQAHTTLAALYNPQFSSWPSVNADTSWVHLKAAVRCDKDDGNAWIPLYVEALRRNDVKMSDQALRRLLDLRFLTPSNVALARWMLVTAPPNAIIITNGDLDYFPAVALQRINGLRPDVAVVNVALLNMPWYTAHVHGRDSVPLPFPADSIDAYVDGIKDVAPDLSGVVIQHLRRGAATGTLVRPLGFELTTQVTSSARLGGVTMMGAFFLISDSARAAEVDSVAVRRALELVHGSEWNWPATSPQDRSPVRRAGSQSPAFYPMYGACVLSAVWLRAGRHTEARAWRVWADSVFLAAKLSDPSSVEMIRWVRSFASDSALSETP